MTAYRQKLWRTINAGMILAAFISPWVGETPGWRLLWEEPRGLWVLYHDILKYFTVWNIGLAAAAGVISILALSGTGVYLAFNLAAVFSVKAAPRRSWFKPALLIGSLGALGTILNDVRLVLHNGVVIRNEVK